MNKSLVMIGLALAGVLISPAVWYFDSVSKQISVHLLSSTTLASVGAHSLAGIKIMSKEKEIVKAQLAILEIENSGYKEIRIADFEERPIRLTLTTSGRIVEASASGSNRPHLEPVVVQSNGVVLLQPLLLNKNDAIRIAILVDGDPPQFDVNVRIAGIASPSIGPMNPHIDQYRRISSNFFGALSAVLLICYAYIFMGVFDQKGGFFPTDPIAFTRRGRLTAAFLYLACAASQLQAIDIDSKFVLLTPIVIFVIITSVLVGMMTWWREWTWGTFSPSTSH